VFFHAHKMFRMMGTLGKVPRASLLFWVIKVLTTGMGETTSDFLVHRFVPEFAIAVAAAVLACSLVVQFKANRCVPWIYWLAVVMVSIFGTMCADVVHVQFGVSYLMSTVFFGALLALIFFAWYSTEKTLSIHSIFTRRRETFYWAGVLTTFALGTAAGDMTATTLNLGYFSSGLLFLAIFAIPAIGYRWLGMNEYLRFGSPIPSHARWVHRSPTGSRSRHSVAGSALVWGRSASHWAS